MNRLVKNISSLLLALVMVFGMTITVAAADSSITYEGGAEKYIFLPGSDYTDTDLFDNFKEVMPGDVLEQKITVKNECDDCDYVKIYMRAELHDETSNLMSENVAAETDFVSMQEFLSQLTMTVWNGSEVIYHASPDELDGLSENVLLGSFKNGESTELTVELSVPIELGNEYANRVGEVDWVFVAEELNDPTPATGDGANVIVWIAIASAAMVTIFGIMKKKMAN